MTDMYEYDLVVIGSGPAGQRAAVQASKLGKRVCVVEKARALVARAFIPEPFPAKHFAKPCAA